MPTEMELVLDFQGFRGPSEQFIFKELSAISVNCKDFYNFLFKPPVTTEALAVDFQRTNRWLTKNHHGLEYNTGFVCYDELYGILHHLFSTVQAVYVKGIEKQKEILKIFNDLHIIDISELGCPTLSELQESYCRTACIWHKDTSFVCATRNVKNILSWYNEYNTAQKTPEANCPDECQSTCWCFCK